MNIKDYSKKVKQNKNVLKFPSDVSKVDNGKRDFIKKGILGLGIGAGAALLSQVPFANAIIKAPNINHIIKH